MQNNLLSIFKAITPDNIKNIPLIEDSMRIFIELLAENSPISSDIKIALSEKTTNSIAEELPKIYLYDYYSMIENIRNDKHIVEKFRNWNELLKPQLYPVGMPIIGEKLIINYFTVGEAGSPLTTEDDNMEDIFDLNPLSTKLNNLKTNLLKNKPENYYINRVFKQSKGLKKGINFIYDIMNEYLVAEQERQPLVITETGNPFELNIIGSLDKDIYDKSVAYLSHPLGFVYDYTYLSEISFEDIYSLISFYNVSLLEVRCLSGNVEAYTKQVTNVIEQQNYLKIVFFDGYYLLQENDVVNYFDNNDLLIKNYPSDNHCSIYLDYTIEYTTVLTDEMSTQIIPNDIVENYTGVSDETTSLDTLEYKHNFIVGYSVVGSELITPDTDYLGLELSQEEFSIETF